VAVLAVIRRGSVDTVQGLFRLVLAVAVVVVLVVLLL
jgi:hypothetical protein